MTTPLASRELTVLQSYDASPVADGDVLLLVDEATCLELGGLADAWEPALFAGLLATLRTARRVVVAVARPGADLLEGDRQMGRDIASTLGEAGVEVPPVQALRAA